MNFYKSKVVCSSQRCEYTLRILNVRSINRLQYSPINPLYFYVKCHVHFLEQKGFTKDRFMISPQPLEKKSLRTKA